MISNELKSIIDFRAFHGLGKYNPKEIDKFLWSFGKDYFPKSYAEK